MRKIFVCLDVGGTEIKGAAIDEDGSILGEIRHFPARAEEEREVLLGHFAGIVNALRASETMAGGIGMAFPGPFDYENGICLLQGLGKYDRLYGVNLRKELAERLKMGTDEILFANDASAFALGEMGFGEAKGAARSLFLCIGTGCGSAFGMDGRLAPCGREGVPEDGYLYHFPFLDGCIDDYISKRGLMTLTKEWLGAPLDGRALAQRVLEGDQEAGKCFLAFGERIRDAVLPFLEAFRPRVLCLGGQITGSASLFLSPVEEICRERGIRFYVTRDTSLRTLQGLTRIAPRGAGKRDNC